MTEGVLALPERVTRRIDRLRGNMSRTEFIEYLIDRYSNYSLGNDELAYRLIPLVDRYIDSHLAHLKSTEENLRVEDSKQAKRFHRAIPWILAVFLFGLSDIFTTQLVLMYGVVEMNPIVSQAIALLELLQSSLLTHIFILGILKAFILVLLFTISRSREKLNWIVPIGLSILGVGVTVTNIFTLLRPT